MKFDPKIIEYACNAITIFFLTGVLVACQSTLFTFRGTTAKETLRIALKPGTQQNATWNAHDLKVDYRYQRNGDTLQIAGNVDLEYRYHDYKTKSFFLELHFLDNENKILDTKIPVIAPNRKRVERYRFDEKFQLPSGTTAIAFSYSGEVKAIGANNNWSFWLDPRRSGRYGIFY